MLIVALVLAVIGLAALVTAVVTSNEVVAWVCIAASVIGVILLIVDAIRERQRAGSGDTATVDAETEATEPAESIDQTYQNFDAEYPDTDIDEPDAQPVDEVSEVDDDTPPSTPADDATEAEVSADEVRTDDTAQDAVDDRKPGPA